MYTYNYGTGIHAYATPHAYTPNPATYGTTPGYVSHPTRAPAPGYATPPPPAGTPMPAHTPTPPALGPVQVPPGHYPIELAQFWRNEHKRGQPFPLHWALFVRTAPRSPSPAGPSAVPHGPGSTRAKPRPPTTAASRTPRGNFYEVVGTPDMYTAQFLPNVTFEPDALNDWRGSHVIGWVHPGQLHVFEKVVRQVPVWRHKPDWGSQQWVYDVVRAVGKSFQGVFMDGVTFGGLQRHMGRLLDAWESGDI